MAGFTPNSEFSKICTELWEVDENRLKPGVDYTINLQEGTDSYSKVDKAPDPLFSSVKDEVLQRPAYKLFIALLDNYESGTSRPEVVTPEEEEEMKKFIDTAMETKVMKKAHEFLVAKGKSPSDLKKFKDQFYDIWFTLHHSARSGVLDSSSFEHVFVGETRDKKVIGLRSWVQFYLQEKAGNVDYQGYILGEKPKEGSHSPAITIQFTWKENTKPIGSMWVGTSPEFEMAVGTIFHLCMAVGTTKTDVDIAGFGITIVCDKIDIGNKTLLGSCHPELVNVVKE